MKRLVDILIVVLVLAVLGVGGYFGYTTFLAEEDDSTSSGGSSGPVASVSGSSVTLPTLTTNQLGGLLPDAIDLPPDLSDATASQPTLVNLNTNQEALSLSSASTATSRFTQIRSSYNWGSAVGITFDACTLNRDTGAIKVHVSQFTNSTTARSLIDDANVRGYYKALHYTLTDAHDVHGWYLTSNQPQSGDCFPSEQQHFLVFDHLGIVVVMQVNTNANASAALGRSTLDALVPRVMSRIHGLEALATVTIPPTPEPSDLSMTLLTANTSPDDVNFLMPSTRDWDLTNVYNSNEDENQRYTLLELLDFYREFNTPALNALADNIDRAGRRYGLIELYIRVWEPDTACVEDDPVRIEADVSLFERPAGADAYMRDASLQEAWRGTGIFNEFVSSENGVYAYGTLVNECGAMQVVQKSATYERLLYTLSMTVSANIDRQTATAQIDAMMDESLSTLYLQRLR